MRARRALLYVPGNDLHKIQKATTLDVDSVCLDLEDGVATNRKQDARLTISRALGSLDFGRTERLVRINPVNSKYIETDMGEIFAARPDGIVLPKVVHGDQIRTVSNQIEMVEKEKKWLHGSIILIAIIESAQAIVNLDSIASADPRLKALIFGAEDYAATIGAKRSSQGWEVFYARSAVVTHSAAYRLQAIDMVNINFEDDEGLRVQSIQGSGMGFSGKQIIHPNQVEIVQEAFTPTEEEVEAAIGLIEKFKAHQNKGQGAFAIEGTMIDAPLMKAAQATIARAKAAGVINPHQMTRLGGNDL